MNELVFYPTLEVRNLSWLKFALLYIEKLRPIIPYGADTYLSDLHRKITNESDLIDIYRPDFNEGERASLDAITILSSRLKYSNRNYLQLWSNIDEQPHILFREKYSHEWERFCLEHKLGKRCKEGIVVSEHLAVTYMSILSQAIADSQGLSSITDNLYYDRITTSIRRTFPFLQSKINVARSIISIQLPANLEDIKLDTLIHLRSNKGFRSKLSAFNSELDGFYAKLGNQGNPLKFIESYSKLWKEFTDEILGVGVGSATYGLQAWTQISHPGMLEDYINQIVGGGTGLAVTSIIAFRSKWKNTHAQRYCRKYLMDLKKLNA